MTILSVVSAIGLYSDLPSPGINGRKYYATDTEVEWYDTGTEWVDITPTGASGLVCNPLSGSFPGTVYTVSTSIAIFVALFYNGVLLTTGYTLSGQTVTLNFTTSAGENLYALYVES